jgi:hypothetical protein
MNLIFDGNYLFYKTLFALGNYSKGRMLESKQDQEMFIRKIATDMAYAVRAFGTPSKVIFTIDSKSWRKDVLIEDGSYKGHRTKDESSVDWDAFYNSMNEFARVLENKGFIVSRIEKAEGDDLMFLWSKKLNEEHKDAVIVTGDKDLTQCVRLNNSPLGDCFTVVYNSNSKTRKIVAPTGFSEFLKEEHVDIFDASSYMGRSKDLISKALNSIDIQEINANYVIFEKVIGGDAGDAVPPIWTWLKGGKTYRVTPAKIQRIYEIMNANKPVTDVYDLPNRAQEVCDAITATTKEVAPVEKIKENLERNLKLVLLDTRVIPQSIQDTFEQEYEGNMTGKEISVKSYDMTSILEGTRFLSGGKTFEADIFSQLGKI